MEPQKAKTQNGRRGLAIGLGAGIGVAIGAGIGTTFGVGVGAAMHNIGVGIGIGAGFGIAIGAGLGVAIGAIFSSRSQRAIEKMPPNNVASLCENFRVIEEMKAGKSGLIAFGYCFAELTGSSHWSMG